MKKVVFIISSLLHRSGMERVACNLANLFVSELGCEVSIINRDTDSINVAYKLDSNVDVLKFNGNVLKFYFDIQRYLEEYKPDCIIVHNMGKLSILCSFLRRNIKLVSLEHVAFDSRTVLLKLISRFCYRRIDRVITLTHKDRESYDDWYPHAQVIYNICPFSPLEENYKRENRVISIGRLTYQKNFNALLNAWKIVKKKIPADWRLEIYGVGEEFEQLNNFIRVNNLTSVQLMGLAESVENIYTKASFFVMSSRYEGLPMVLIEAQTFALPIIAFDCPHGPSEVIENNRNGYLVNNQDITSLADKILDLILSSEKRELFSNNALVDSKRFQQENIIELWKDCIYESKS
ncbi:TPA: glycosyltransferase family 4 protein [Mannheimia haemolytica]